MTGLLALIREVLRAVAARASCLVRGHDWTLWADATEILHECDRCPAARSFSIPFLFEDDPTPDVQYGHA